MTMRHWLNAGLSLGSAYMLHHLSAVWAAGKVVPFGGHTWHPTTREELSDFTGLSFKRVMTALQELKKAGAIKVEQHKHDGVAKSFIRLLPSALFGEGPPQAGLQGPSYVGPIGPSQVSPEGPAPGDVTLAHETSGDSLQGGPHGLSHAGLIGPSQGGLDGPATGGISLGDKSDGSNAQGGHGGPAQDGPIGPSAEPAASFTAMWQQAVAEMPGGDGVLLTPDQIDQLHQLFPACEEGKPQAILNYARTHWPAFTKRVAVDLGLDATPNDFSSGFLVKHVATAVRLWLQRSLIIKFTKPVAAPPPAPMQPPATQPAAEVAEASKKGRLKIVNTSAKK